MKKTIVLMFAGSLVVAPLAMAKGSMDDAEKALQAGTDYGISQFTSIEFDDDGHSPVELEGWVDEEWYVELDVTLDGSIEREQRRKHSGEAGGATAEEIRTYLASSREQGLAHVEEIDVRSNGGIEIEGEGQDGREVELVFRPGNNGPVRVERER